MAFDPRAVRGRCKPGRGLEGRNIHRPCAGAQPPEEAGGSSPRVGGNPEGLGCRWRERCCAALRPETRLAKRAVDLGTAHGRGRSVWGRRWTRKAAWRGLHSEGAVRTQKQAVWTRPLPRLVWDGEGK